MTKPPSTASKPNSQYGPGLRADGTPFPMRQSSYATFADPQNGCRRKWYRSIVDQEPIPEKASTARGTMIHDFLENYVNTGKPPESYTTEVYDPLLKTLIRREVEPTKTREWAAAMAVVPHLPFEVEPGVGGPKDWVTEFYLHDIKCGPLPYHGAIDLCRIDGDSWVIDDYKTTKFSDFRYSKSTPEALRAAHQPRVYTYAYALMHGLEIPEEVTFRHYNVSVTQVNGEYPVLVVETPCTREECEEAWADLVAAAEEMYAISAETSDWREVEPNTEACGAFGGCPFAESCPASPKYGKSTSLASSGGDPSPEPKWSYGMSWKDKLKARHSALKGTTPQPAAEEAPEPQKATMPPEMAEKAQKLGKTIRNGVPIARATIEKFCATMKLDFDAFCAAGGISWDDDGKPQAAEAPEAPEAAEAPETAEAPEAAEDTETPKSGAVEDTVAYLHRSTIAMSAAELFAKAKFSSKHANPQTVNVLTSIAMLQNGQLTKLGEAVYAELGMGPPQSEEAKTPSEPRDEDEAVKQAIISALRAEGGVLSKKQVKTIIRAERDLKAVHNSRIEAEVAATGVAIWDASTDRVVLIDTGAVREEDEAEPPEDEAEPPEEETGTPEEETGTPEEEADTPEEEADTPEPVRPHPKTRKTVLYLDCLPEAPVTDLARLLAPYERMAADQGGKVDGRKVPSVAHYSLLDYGKGKQVVLSLLAGDLDDAGSVAALWNTDALFLSSNHPLAGEATSLLRCDPNVTVIRAVR